MDHRLVICQTVCSVICLQFSEVRKFLFFRKIIWKLLTILSRELRRAPLN